jgi:hypothetical protein
LAVSKSRRQKPAAFAFLAGQTLVSLTPTGREQIKQHWRRLEKLRADAAKMKPHGK